MWLARCWIDFGEQAKTVADYEAEKRALEGEIESLSTIGEGETFEAGQVLQDFAGIWEAATESERRDTVQTVLERVLVDTEARDIIAIKPRRPFLPIFSTHPHLLTSA